MQRRGGLLDKMQVRALGKQSASGAARLLHTVRLDQHGEIYSNTHDARRSRELSFKNASSVRWSILDGYAYH